MQQSYTYRGLEFRFKSTPLISWPNRWYTYT